MTLSLSSFLSKNENECVEALLDSLPWGEARARIVESRAAAFVENIRAQKRSGGKLEMFLQDYSLKSEEGLALMCLAEALLRIPDKATAHELIRDKTVASNWLAAAGNSKGWMTKAAGLGLFVTSKTLDSALSRVGEPVIREAMVKAMRILGENFVLGESIEQAVQNAKPFRKKGYRMSYDVLGEGARTAGDAQRYFESYDRVIDYLGKTDHTEGLHRSGLSVKLSALHPRYEVAQEERCIPEMTQRLAHLAAKAASYNLPLTVDAEEVDRLELSLKIIEGVLDEKALRDWDGFGLALQAYQKRALPLIDHLAQVAQKYKHRLQIRLVKGAYWDSEIKRAQVLGLADYPVFTRKVNTDLSYLACASKLFEHQDYFYPMLATHNAHSVAAALAMARESGASFEFQRLYGMGGGLFDLILKEEQALVSVYAPVGPYEELLPYLVRRLLENGANSSFVNQLLNPDEPVSNLVADPVDKIRCQTDHYHSKIPLPGGLFSGEGPAGRINSSGLDLSDPPTVQTLLQNMKKFQRPYEAESFVAGQKIREGEGRDIRNPADQNDGVGRVWSAGVRQVEAAFEAAQEAFPVWSGTPAALRAEHLERFADLLEENRAELMALCVREAGKTIPDALGEVREAVDFCRYYAARGRIDFSEEGQILPGPTGESNGLTLHGRGIFVCISPWNFPLAIFIGQVSAALMAGNTVISKPAEQTPLVAMRAVELMHEAGILRGAVNLLPGDGKIGAALVSHGKVAGVSFTGSTEVAREINRALAAKEGPIVPLVAETGGQNAMIVDSSALPEQVVDDVILSAFGSAGQRCSALRVLCLQDDVADKILHLLQGAMKELRVGNPGLLSSDLGPVIDKEAQENLIRHLQKLKGGAKLVYQVPLEGGLEGKGFYFAPCLYELENLSGLEREVFGPVLHVVRYKKEKLPDLIEDINAKGYGLTVGVHSRIESFQQYVSAQVRAGNAYVNRSMIGAVVGSQPFGGQGLSGTGPKAGGPHYLPRFATEKVISIDTTAAGGNASLVSLEE